MNTIDIFHVGGEEEAIEEADTREIGERKQAATTWKEVKALVASVNK